MPVRDESGSSITPPSRSLDLERPNRPYVHRPESTRSAQRRYAGGGSISTSPIYSASSSSSLPGEFRQSFDSGSASSIAGPRRRYTGSSPQSPGFPLSTSSLPIRNGVVPGPRKSTSIELPPGRMESTSSSQARRGSESSSVLSNSSDVDLSIVQRRDEEDEEFDENNEILEFRLNHDSDSGIIRQRTSTEDGVPELIRYSTSSNANTTSVPMFSPTESDELEINGNDVLETESKRPVEQHKRTSSHPPTHKDEMFTQSLDPHKPHVRDSTLPSEFSHQSALQSEFANLGGQGSPDDHNLEKQEEQEEEWQEMKTVGSYEVYDDKGKVIVHKKSDGENIDDERDDLREKLGHASAAKGYTRVAVDDDAKSINSLDENTDFLFGEDELERNPLSQLQATKDMLTDSQKIAYVGLCRLVMHMLGVELASLKGGRMISSSLSNAQGSMAMWGQKMMIRLYTHMDIKSEGTYNS